MRLPTTGTIVGANILLAACVLAGWDDDSQKPPPLSTLIKQLERGEDFERSDALRRMEEYGPEAAPATPAVRRALKSGDQDTREQCLDVLAEIGPAAKPALPDVIKLLDESEQGLYAGSAALRIRPVGMKDVPRLIEELKGPGEGDRAFAACALGRVCWGAMSRYHVGPSMDRPVAALAAVLTDKSDRVRALATDALGLIGGGSDKAVAALIEQLETGRPRVRLQA
ncbi:MAG: HEAT repeat domain-containing protein, partial [Phycisphaerae bacterium]